MRSTPILHRLLLVALVVLGTAASPAMADPPANDARGAATALSPPGGVNGTTTQSTLEAEQLAQPFDVAARQRQHPQ